MDSRKVVFFDRIEASTQWLRDNAQTNAITILCDRGERYLSCL